jgi:hypothetical protein
MGTRLFKMLVLSAALSAGCLGDYTLKNNQDMEVVGGQEDGGGGGSSDPVVEFAEKVAPILGGADGKTGACGACHGAGGVSINFLAPKPTILDGVLSYPGIVGKTPETSRMYAKGQHDGPALTPAEKPIVANWIINWNLNGPKVVDMGKPKPIVEPFAPATGANTVDLSVLDPNAAGITITFDANVSGTNLILTKLSIKAMGAMGVRIKHPLFVTWDTQLNATPDPIDSFSGLDQSIAAGTTTTLGPGTLVLPNFQAGYKVNVVFGDFLPMMVAGTDGGVITACKATANFAANVRPLIAGATPGCQAGNCHGGGAAGLTMAGGLTDADYCLNVRNELDFTTPANSRILTKPNPGSAVAHQGGKMAAAAFATFQTAVNNWLNLEK